MSPVRFEAPHDDELARGGATFFGSALGMDLERAEMALLRQLLGDCFGARALLLGAGSDERVLDALHVQRRYVARIAEVDVARRCPVSRTHASVVDAGNLPFANESFDVVILFHALDLSARPHQALREAARVLTDGGRLLVTGFNPWSLWGLRRMFSPRRAPWNSNFINPVRMADWLSLLDFNVSRTEFCYYRPPFAGGARFFDSSAIQFAKRAARMPFGGVWIMKARRLMSAATPVAQAAAAAADGRAAAAARPAVRGAARSPERRAVRRVGNVYPLAGIHDRDR